MTYNQIVNQLQSLLETHPMINAVRFATPTEWLAWDEEPKLPVALFSIATGNFNAGREITYQVQFWFLDKSGVESEFETDVVSDQHQVAGDIILTLRQDRTLVIDSNIVWNAVSEKFEDYLSGVTLTFTISTIGEFNACDFPVKIGS